mgnify:CR=1 FL=1
MKNNQEKAAMTAAEKLGEALVLKPEWEVKPKSVVMTHVFSVEFNESTKDLKQQMITYQKELQDQIRQAEDHEKSLKKQIEDLEISNCDKANEIKDLVEFCYKAALNIIEKNKNIFHIMTQELLDIDIELRPAPYWTFYGKKLSEIYEDTYDI